MFPDSLLSCAFRRHGSMVLLGVAAGLAAWLAWNSLRNGGMVSGCGAAQGCSQVLGSRFAFLLGLPVSVFGLLLYLSALTAVVRRRPTMAVLAALGILAGACWFVTVQAVILKAWCPWCSLAHGLAALAALLILAGRGPQGAGAFFPVGKIRSLLGFLILLGALAGVQLSSAPVGGSRYQSASAVPGMMVLTVAETGEVSLLNNRVKLDPRKVPVLGQRGFMSATQAMQNPLEGLMAPQPVVLLSDWTCPHCRQLLGKLAALKQSSSSPATEGAATKSSLATAMETTSLILLPAWRDEEAREIHSLMLAAWMEGEQTFVPLRDGLCDGTIPPTREAINAKALSLAGEKWEISKKQAAPWVAEVLAMGADTLRESDLMLTEATLPRMISAGGMLSGAPKDADLLTFLQTGSSGLAQQTEDVKNLAAPNKSRIEFEATAVRTPAVSPGQTAHGEFHFSNTGTEPLNIVSIRTSCACTLLEGWKQTVPPGGKGSFIVNVDTTGHVASMTRQFSLIVNAGNAPDGGQIPLRITAEIVPPDPAVAGTAPGRRQFN